MKKGYLGIKRTDKSFSRQPTDLTLEQTINADAAKRLTGVLHFTNSISARQRWAKSHDIRSTIISYTYEVTGLQKRQDVTSDLESHRIKKDCNQLQKFMNTFDKFMNPFDVNIDQQFLFNISTGKAASIPVQEFLLGVEKSGNELRQNFISECSISADRFKIPIKKTNIINFSADTAKKKIKIGDKVHEIRMQRDLFGRILGLSMDYRVDLERILSFPITPIPISMPFRWVYM